MRERRSSREGGREGRHTGGAAVPVRVSILRVLVPKAEDVEVDGSEETRKADDEEVGE